MRLIDALELKRSISASVLCEDGKRIFDIIDEQPTIEPKKGKWIWSDEDASWKCGKCDCVFEEIDWKPEYNFCPNCGADMREGETDD